MRRLTSPDLSNRRQGGKSRLGYRPFWRAGIALLSMRVTLPITVHSCSLPSCCGPPAFPRTRTTSTSSCRDSRWDQAALPPLLPPEPSPLPLGLPLPLLPTLPLVLALPVGLLVPLGLVPLLGISILLERCRLLPAERTHILPRSFLLRRLPVPPVPHD
jgi:hypothetical protein